MGAIAQRITRATGETDSDLCPLVGEVERPDKTGGRVPTGFITRRGPVTLTAARPCPRGRHRLNAGSRLLVSPRGPSRLIDGSDGIEPYVGVVGRFGSRPISPLASTSRRFAVPTRRAIRVSARCQSA